MYSFLSVYISIVCKQQIYCLHCVIYLLPYLHIKKVISGRLGAKTALEEENAINHKSYSSHERQDSDSCGSANSDENSGYSSDSDSSDSSDSDNRQQEEEAAAKRQKTSAVSDGSDPVSRRY